MLLIHPPVAKPSEPPAGIARLAGALRRHDLDCTALDANLEGLLYLIGSARGASDTWSRRAHRNRTANLDLLRDHRITANPDRYRRTVSDINRVIENQGRRHGIRLGLCNYEDPALSPQKSGDLLRAAEHPESNIYFPWFSKRFDMLMDKKRPAAVGISLNFLNQALCSFAMLGYLKKHYPDTALFLGGGLVTSWLSNPEWRDPFSGLVDHLVQGPGEDALLSWFGVPPPNEWYTPDYTGLPAADYISPEPVLPYAASIGCFWRKCSFCPESAEMNPYRPVPVKQVLDEIHNLTSRVRPGLVHLLDNAVAPNVMKALARNPPGIPWYGFGRIDERLADPDFCQALRRSGCSMIKLGLESGDQDVLDAMNKGITLSDASRVLAALRDAGIATYVYLLFGTPAETEARARQTMKFVVDHRDAIGFLNVALFNMPLGCGGDRPVPVRRFYEGDLSLYTDFEHPKGWNRKNVRLFLDREFRRHPDIAVIIRRDPPLFTSNHAPFFANGLN